jgi:hypothetical protein
VPLDLCAANDLSTCSRTAPVQLVGSQQLNISIQRRERHAGSTMEHDSLLRRSIAPSRAAGGVLKAQTHKARTVWLCPDAHNCARLYNLYILVSAVPKIRCILDMPPI